ncbi:hypothetical protein CGG88_21515 [Vibrio parahaemolyticus]|uniref:hypothetical protein n=1 Tax=Vibrio parahaemolyticus TaxID=670 RepID=UPI0011235372|nr:hypothetical protein [Vibrio parahaemolyticus]EGQ8101621.1 hypothetical protein [Vibrio parahaemolyticus]EGQ8453545.1 hypothetical protein [Vibrio parahaemolyticus]EHR0248067.1 hypothetical protein [Vibrio parahaemolyticus]EID4382243.1 hypothetical protein [Vibrio parahaemolyticus]EJH2591477.1 hypothetical protein [Vibrio parahaemolyticus]
MDKPFFKGRVLLHPAYQRVQDKTYTSEFKQYWINGFSPLIGKDGILPVPEIYSEHAIGRAHVEPAEKTNHCDTATDQAWFLWSVGQTNTVPTSNSMLVYCVDNNRDACLLAYLDGGEENSHSILNDPTFRRNVRDRALEFFKSQGSEPMPASEHEYLFDEKWKN